MDRVVHDEHAHLLESHWWFRARRSIFARFLDRNVRLTAGARILDVGPGSGANLSLLAPRGEVDVLDIDRGSLEECRRRGARRVVCGDAVSPPLAAKTYDLVCMLDVLEHLDDDAGSLRNMRTLIKDDGHLMVSVPALQILWGRQDVLSEHKRRYRRGQLRRRLTEAGFAIERLTYFNTLLLPPILAVRLAMRPFLGRAKSRSDLSVPAFGLDGVLHGLFASEGRWLSGHDLPIGVSLLALARPKR